MVVMVVNLNDHGRKFKRAQLCQYWDSWVYVGTERVWRVTQLKINRHT